MANHGYGISRSQLPQTSDDESSNHSSRSLATLSGGTSYVMGGATVSSSKEKPTKSSPPPGYWILGGGGNGSGDLPNPHQNFPAPKKSRGRPRGSKNKPKPPGTIIREVDDIALKPVVIEISTGADVVEELIKFAQRHEMGLTVLSGSGSVTNVTLHQPFSHTTSLTLHETFTLLSLSGTYMISSPFPSPPTIPCSEHSSFAVCLAGTQGQVFGGVIAGKIIAASLVVVVATLCKNPMFHRLPNNSESDDVVADDVSTSRRSGRNNASPIESGMDNNDAIMAMPTAALNIASPISLNFHVPFDANVNVMQWGYPNRHPNY